MPRGPKGEKQPADVIGNAVGVMRIATGEEVEEMPNDGKDPAAKALGKKGGVARAKSMTPERRIRDRADFIKRKLLDGDATSTSPRLTGCWSGRRRPRATGKYTSVEYARFADDLVILIDAHQRHDWLMAAVEKRLREELAELQVEINEEKSRIVDLRRGESFGFLGFDFRRVRSLRARSKWRRISFPPSLSRSRSTRWRVPPQSSSPNCHSAWNKDPVFGVIGIQSGPRG